MTEPGPAAGRLRRLPRAERRAALEDILVADFKAALLMSVDDELPVDANYFELGLTSLRVSELKERLEQQLDCELDIALLFSSPTVAALADHITSQAVPGLLDADSGLTEHDRTLTAHKPLIDDMLRGLYER